MAHVSQYGCLTTNHGCGPDMTGNRIKWLTESFKKHQSDKRAWEVAGKPEGDEPHFAWDPSKDFKDVPVVWIPADGVEIVNGVPQPDKNGHIPGWVPVEPKSRQHCWHSQTVEFDSGLALVLQPDPSDVSQLQITLVPLSELLDCTMELIGTNVNANPYKIGSKQRPLHFLVRHGGIPVSEIPQTSFGDLKKWLSEHDCGQIEGIVWHCKNGKLFKLHRHHLEMKWPVVNPRLSSLPISIHVNLGDHPDADFGERETFRQLNKLHGQTFLSVSQIEYAN